MKTDSASSNESPEQAAAQWLMLLRDPEPGDDRMERWRDWIDASPKNREAFERASDLDAALVSLDADRKRALLRRLVPPTASHAARPPVRGMSRGLWIAASAAAALSILVALAFFLEYRPAVLNTTYSTLRAENRLFDLPDGSQVELGASTRLEVAYGKDTRSSVLHEGQAYFTVRHDEQHPFTVQAGALRITDVGTRFDIRKSGDNVVVTVTEGAVDIEIPRQSAVGTGLSSPRTMRVRAGEQVVVESAAHAPTIAEIDTRSAASWRSGKLDFQNEPLDVVIANINRYAGHEIVIVDAEVARMRFTGVVFEDRIDDWLTGTAELFGLDTEVAGDGRVLVRVKGGPPHAPTWK